MTQVLIPILVAVIGALGTIAAAVIVEIIRQDGKTSRKYRRPVVLLISVNIVLLVAVVGFIAYILLLPTPRARIVKPEDYDRHNTVPVESKVVVEYNDIPSDRYIWVVVRIPTVRPMWLAYPQLMDGIPTPVTGSGRFETSVNLGGGADSGIPFNIVVLLLDGEANQAFKTYSKNCLDTGGCSGIALPYPGVEVLDFVTVIRE
jgi:hypothetical protein